MYSPKVKSFGMNGDNDADKALSTHANNSFILLSFYDCKDDVHYNIINANLEDIY